MNNDRKSSKAVMWFWIGILILVLAAVLLFVSAYYGYRANRIKTADYIEHATQAETFTSYDSIDMRKNGSSMKVSFYDSPDGFIMTEIYHDYGNRCSYRHTVLDEDHEKLIRELVSQPFKASTADESGETYKKGVVKFSMDGKSSTYSIEPLDLSGFDIKDPQSNPNIEKNMNLIGDMPEYCDVFDSDIFESVLGFPDKPQMRAYLDSVFRQLAAQLVGSGDEQSDMDVAESMIRYVYLEHVDENSYEVSVELEDGDRKTFTIMKTGYVLKKDL